MIGFLLAFANNDILSSPAAFACDIALTLAVDVSGSVDGREYRIQMDGVAAALADRADATDRKGASNCRHQLGENYQPRRRACFCI